MAWGKRRSRKGPVIGAIVLVLALVVGVGLWVNRGALQPEPGGPPVPGPFGDEPTPQPTQPADCPDTEVIAVPGTWESSPTDDPLNPTFNPNSLLLKITAPLQQANDPGRLKAYTIPYTAQFRNPQSPQEMTYDQSRREGTDKVRAELQATHAHCPYTGFALLGFSQGAVIAGDVANEIGTSGTPVPADAVRSVILIADGRRDQGAPGPPVQPSNGQGMEIALQPVSGITQLVAGATMTGPRPGGGFGALTERTASICAAEDMICNAPMSVVDGAARLDQYLHNNAVHAQYDTNPDVVLGTTTTAWAREQLQTVIDEAPQIAHG